MITIIMVLILLALVFYQDRTIRKQDKTIEFYYNLIRVIRSNQHDIN